MSRCLPTLLKTTSRLVLPLTSMNPLVTRLPKGRFLRCPMSRSIEFVSTRPCNTTWEMDWSTTNKNNLWAKVKLQVSLLWAYILLWLVPEFSLQEPTWNPNKHILTWQFCPNPLLLQLSDKLNPNKMLTSTTLSKKYRPWENSTITTSSLSSEQI